MLSYEHCLSTLLDIGFVGRKSGAVVNHIRVKRMWQYAHMKVELTVEELAHMSNCELCLKLFKICVLTESPALIDLDDEPQEKSA